MLGGSVGGSEGGPEGGPLGGPLGGLDGGPDGGPLGGPEGGPLGGAAGGFSGGASDGEGASAGGCSRAPMSPNAPPSKLSSWDCSLSSRAFSADVFPFAMTAPVSPTWRGLNSGCAPEGLQLPAWCRGYHAGLSFLRPGFNSRSGRHPFPPFKSQPRAQTQQPLVLWSSARALPKDFTKEITFVIENENFLRSIVHGGRGNRSCRRIARTIRV